MARSWYVYIGIGDPLLFSSYARLTIKHNALCGNEICVIYSEGEEFRLQAPLSPNLQKYIKDALITGQLQPEQPANAKKYVYLRYKETQPS